MEAKKLEKQIEVWALSLGFKFSDGSAPPPNFFSLLTSTPHRRKLWDILIEAVHLRSTVECMKKQLLVANLKNFSYGNKSNITRLDTWKKQNSLEKLINQKKNLIAKLETDVVTKASDLLLKICSLSELKKQHEDLKEKTLVVQILSKQIKKLTNQIESCLLIVVRNSEKNYENCFEVLQAMLNADFPVECKCSENHDCSITKKLEKIRNIDVSEENLWEEIVSYKKFILEKLDKLFEELNSNQRTYAREKYIEIQKILKLQLTELKQKVTEKSLQIILSETENQVSNLEIQRLENILSETQANSSLYESCSFLTLEEIKKTHISNEEKFMAIKNHINISALMAYKKYLEEELLKMVEKNEKNSEKEKKNMKMEFQQPSSIIQATCNEIHYRCLQLEEQSGSVIGLYEEFEALIEKIRNEARKESFMARLEKVVTKLKTSSERQMELFTEIPLDAFRMIERPIGCHMFESGFSSYYLSNYGGEFKQFFSSMLISPYQSTEAISGVIQKRQKLIEETQKFIVKRLKLSERLRDIFSNLVSVKYNHQFCQGSLRDSEKILRNVLCKANEIDKKIDFTKKGLKNWVEQPYALMLRQTTVSGPNFINYEKNYKKSQKEIK